MFSQQILTQIALLGISIRAVTGLPSGWGPWGGPKPAKAVYVMTNDVDSNAIIAMSVGSDGSLSGGSATATGGKGGNLIGADGMPDFPDALSVQDSVNSAGNYLFAVNAGSNTLSMFSVSESDPLDVTMLGQPQDTNGIFPVAVAVSLSMKTACVANQGMGSSGVSCTTFSDNGLEPFDELRPMDFGATQYPPQGPVPGVGDIFFSEDDSSLLVMVKGNAMPAFAGFAAKYAVADGEVAATGTQTTPPDSAALFGTGLIPGSNDIVFASDAGFGALILNIDDLAAAPIGITNVTGQIASCWAQVSTKTGTGFITDVARNRLVEASIQDGSIITEYYPPNPFNGMSDFRIVGDYMWTLSASNGSYPTSITTFDISGGPGTVKQSSVYTVPLGAGHNTMGLVTM